MQRFGKIVLGVLAVVVGSGGSVAFGASREDAMLRDLQTLQNHFELYYAPFDWKKTYAQWSLGAAADDARSQIRSNPLMSVADYHRVLKSFMVSPKDYHVGISFLRTERATLPFSVVGVGNKYFVVYVDRMKASQDVFPFDLGDELVSIGGRPTHDVAQELAELSEGDNVRGTDLALGSIFVTRRSAASAFPVPQGPVDLVFLRKGAAKPVTHQMVWDYVPESLNLDVAGIHNLKTTQPPTVRDRALRMSNKSMLLNRPDLLGAAPSSNPYGLGTRVGYLPELGSKIWETEESSNFYAYIYMNAEGKLIGVLRLPTYSPAGGDDAFDAHVQEFAEIVQKFEAQTDVMVIDQLNNPGGSVYYLYALASMLSPSALSTPHHRRMLTPTDVMDAVTLLKQLAGIRNDLEAYLALGMSLAGYPVSYQLVLSLRDEANFIVNEWNAGRRFANPYHLGIDKINPAPTHFTKPILVLTNELDFSGGDFFPTILQDNARATIMGARTAGAGGYVLSFEFPNLFGISGFSVTGSIAERVTGFPIENLGVTPDVPYQVTESDLRNGYQDYVKAINAQVEKMTP